MRLSDKEAVELVADHDIQKGNGELHVELMYPRSSEIKHITVGLCDVRAADDIRIGYDYDRDGWVVEQASKFSWSADDAVCDRDWQEVAFIQAWGRESEDDEHA